MTTLTTVTTATLSHSHQLGPHFHLGLFDTHAHLDYEYEGAVGGYIDRALAKGVSRILTVGANAAHWSQLRQWSEEITKLDIYFSVGTHPHDATQFDDALENEMIPYLAHPRCKALGEIGLDYHYDHSPRTVQMQVCERQLALAHTKSKPVIIHSRMGEDDLHGLLKNHVKALGGGHLENPGVIHCFSGSVDFARKCLDLGFYISFSGIVTFKKAEEVREAAKLVPLDRMLIETDAPYLAPVPHRGHTNESSYLVHTAQFLADLKAVPLPELARATTANAMALFAI